MRRYFLCMPVLSELFFGPGKKLSSVNNESFSENRNSAPVETPKFMERIGNKAGPRLTEKREFPAVESFWEKQTVAENIKINIISKVRRISKFNEFPER